MEDAPPQMIPLVYVMTKKNAVESGGYSLPIQRRFPNQNLLRWKQTVSPSNSRTHGYILQTPV